MLLAITGRIRLDCGFPRRMAIWIVVLSWFADSTPAFAIPAFARRYETSCATCHVLIPKLNAFGTAYRNNGYRIPPHDDKYVKLKDVSLGAPAWKRVWPDAVWPGAISATAPIALRMFHDVVIDPGDAVALDFVFPREFELIAGGTAGGGISYFAELEVLRSQDAGNDQVNMERMFIQFDHLGGTTLANLLVGRFEMRAVPFSRFHRRLTPSEFLAMDFRSPADGLHLRRSQAGAELWGAKSGTGGRGGIEYALGVVNGTGPQPDNNTAKDVYVRLARKLGGFGVTGSLGGDAAPPSPENWRDDSMKLGLSCYVGTGRWSGARDRFWRLSGDIDAFVGRLNISTVAIRGEDSFATPTPLMRYSAVSVEADYVVLPWIVAIVRGDGVWRDDGADVRRVVPALAFAIRANVRAVAEWQAFLDTSHEGVRASSGNSVGRVRLDIAF